MVECHRLVAKCMITSSSDHLKLIKVIYYALTAEHPYLFTKLIDNKNAYKMLN